jgi:hypothetical protein
MNSSFFKMLLPISSGKILLGLSTLVFFFWGAISILNDVYEFALVGVVAEIMWLPMLLFLFTLPVIAIIRLFLKQAKAQIFSWVSLLVCAGSLLFVFLR